MNAADVLRYGQLTLLGTLEGLGDEGFDLPGACGVWSVKDIFAHLASYELVLVDILGAETGERRDTPHLDRFTTMGPAFNDAEVDARTTMGLEEVLAELGAAHDETLRLVASIPPERLREPGTLPWYGADYAIDDLIVYQYYGHKREHAAQVDAFRDHRGRLVAPVDAC
jgi:hypothetical protein